MIIVKLTEKEAKALEKEALVGKNELHSVAAHRALCKLSFAMEKKGKRKEK